MDTTNYGEDWGAVKARLERLCALPAKDVPCQDDIRAALGRVEELEQTKNDQELLAVKRAEAAEAKFKDWSGTDVPALNIALSKARDEVKALRSTLEQTIQDRDREVAKLARCVEALEYFAIGGLDPGVADRALAAAKGGE